MKKLLILLTSIFILTNCHKISNIKTSKDNPDIPFSIIQLAESEKDLLKSDTTNIILYKSFNIDNYQYDYKITNKKIEFIKKIKLEEDPTPLLLLPLISLLLGFLIGLSILN